jgi:hypothetical protein
VSRRISLAFAAAAVAVAVWPAGGANALAPDQTAYWVQPQSSSLPAPLPPPPDPLVPAGGLYVANTPDGAKAISAIHYTVDETVSADLVLSVHSYTTAADPSSLPASPPAEPPSPNPSLIHVAACVADPWVPPADGGAGVWEHRPTYRVDDCVLGQFSSDGATLSFHLTADRQASHGVFDLALVPVAVAVDPSVSQEKVNRPFSVTFNPPREESLTPGEADDPEPEPEVIPDFVVEEPPAPEPTVGVIEPPTFTGGDLGGSLSAPASVAKTAPKPKVPRVNLAPGVVTPAVAIPGDGRGERTMAVGLLGLLALAWWWVGGQVSRGPQLLGSLASDDRRPRRATEPTGGIGRFARPRDGRPRPLI